jgi:DNA-binding MarR family transcriptional regulator
MHAAKARPEVTRLLDLMEESHRAARFAQANSGWMDLDLTLGQIRFLHVLNRAGPMSIGHVAEQLGVTLTTASQFVDRLELRGHVERVHRDDDRRVVECRLTERGAAVTAAMRGMQREVLGALLGNLKPREVAVFERLYRLMLERAAANATGAEKAACSPAPSRPRRAFLAPSQAG